MVMAAQDSVQTVQAMKAAGKELKTAMKRDELDISGIERMQDDMADIMVPIPCPCCSHVLPSSQLNPVLLMMARSEIGWSCQCITADAAT